jgi:hypothetical protein
LVMICLALVCWVGFLAGCVVVVAV